MERSAPPYQARRNLLIPNAFLCHPVPETTLLSFREIQHAKTAPVSPPDRVLLPILVPIDLRAAAGARYVVRALQTSRHDEALLRAAALGWSLAHLFARLRQGQPVDLRQLGITPGDSPITSAGAALPSAPDAIAAAVLRQDRLPDLLACPSAPTGIAFESAAPLRPAPAAQPLLAERIDQYLLQRERGGLSVKNLADAKVALRTFLFGVCGNRRLDAVGVAERDAVLHALLHWPVNAARNRKLQHLNVAQTIAAAGQLGLPTLAPRTIEKHLDRIRVFFTWAVEQRYIDGANPFAHSRLMSKTRRGKKARQPFDEADLARLFNLALRAACANRPHRFWGPLIALFSGMRVNEIGQLYLDDLRQVGTVWVFDIGDARPGQSVKNAASRRLVPVHRQLLALGLLDYAEDVRQAGFVRLFPELSHCSKNGYGHTLSKWFNGSHLRPAPGGSRQPRAGIADPGKTFHSFRYVVANRLYVLTGRKTLVAEITGHERGSDVLTSVYLTPSDAAERAALLNRLDYPSLTFEEESRGS